MTTAVAPARERFDPGQPRWSAGSPGGRGGEWRGDLLPGSIVSTILDTAGGPLEVRAAPDGVHLGFGSGSRSGALDRPAVMQLADLLEFGPDPDDDDTDLGGLASVATFQRGPDSPSGFAQVTPLRDGGKRLELLSDDSTLDLTRSEARALADTLTSYGAASRVDTLSGAADLFLGDRQFGLRVPGAGGDPVELRFDLQEWLRLNWALDVVWDGFDEARLVAGDEDVSALRVDTGAGPLLVSRDGIGDGPVLSVRPAGGGWELRWQTAGGQTDTVDDARSNLSEAAEQLGWWSGEFSQVRAAVRGRVTMTAAAEAFDPDQPRWPRAAPGGRGGEWVDTEPGDGLDLPEVVVPTGDGDLRLSVDDVGDIEMDWDDGSLQAGLSLTRQDVDGLVDALDELLDVELPGGAGPEDPVDGVVVDQDLDVTLFGDGAIEIGWDGADQREGLRAGPADAVAIRDGLLDFRAEVDDTGPPDTEPREKPAGAVEAWDPALHPRGPDGRFIRKGVAAALLGAATAQTPLPLGAGVDQPPLPFGQLVGGVRRRAGRAASASVRRAGQAAASKLRELANSDEVRQLLAEGSLAALRAIADQLDVPAASRAARTPTVEDAVRRAFTRREAVEAARGFEATTPGGRRLKRYWTKDPEGLAKWAGKPHPWTALYRQLRRQMPAARAKRVASAWFKEVFGIWPGERAGQNPVGPG